MKKKLFAFPTILLALLYYSCKKETSGPGYNINGYWYGAWASKSEISGTFICGIEQNFTTFEGKVSIDVQAEVPEYYSAEFEGTISDKKIKAAISIELVEIFVKGSFSDETKVEGEFNVPLLSHTGTYIGEKLPSSTPETEAFYTFNPGQTGERIRNILYVEDQLWLFFYPCEYIDDEVMCKKVILDLNGNMVSSGYFPDGGYSHFYDGKFIWAISNGNNLFKFKTDGTRLDTLKLPFNSCHLTGDGKNLFFPIDNKNMLVTDYAINTLDTVSFSYMNNWWPALLHNQNFYTSTYKTIFIYDKNGQIKHAFKLDEVKHTGSLASDGKSIWFLTEKHETAPGKENEPLPFASSSFTIYRINLP